MACLIVVYRRPPQCVFFGTIAPTDGLHVPQKAPAPAIFLPLRQALRAIWVMPPTQRNTPRYPAELLPHRGVPCLYSLFTGAVQQLRFGHRPQTDGFCDRTDRVVPAAVGFSRFPWIASVCFPLSPASVSFAHARGIGGRKKSGSRTGTRSPGWLYQPLISSSKRLPRRSCRCASQGPRRARSGQSP